VGERLKEVVMPLDSQTNGEATGLMRAVTNAADGVFVLDRDRRYVYCSESCARITGLDRGQIVGTQCRCFDMTSCRDAQGRSLAGALCPGLSVFEGNVPYARQRMTLTHLHGHSVPVETLYLPLYDAHGTVASVLGVVRPLGPDAPHEKGATDWSTIETVGSLTPQEASRRALEEIERTTSAADQAEAGSLLDAILRNVERQEILVALRRAGGQRASAARELGITRSRLYRRMVALHIDPRSDV
jgi:hypothetical protein